MTKLWETGGGNRSLGVSLYDAIVRLSKIIIEIDANITASLARFLERPISWYEFLVVLFSRDIL